MSGAPTFASPTRRDVVLGTVMAGAAAVAFAGMPRRRLSTIGAGQLDKIVPLELAPWSYATASGLVLPPPDQLAQLLYDQQVARFYTATEALPVMLMMAYGSTQSGMLQIHRPEVCYPSGGFRLTETRTRPMDIGGGRSIPVRSFTAASDTRVEQVLYWSRIGNILPTSWTAQRLAVMRSNFDGFVPDGLLVRLSAITQDREQGRLALERFARTMLAAAGARGRGMLIGPAA